MYTPYIPHSVYSITRKCVQGHHQWGLSLKNGSTLLRLHILITNQMPTIVYNLYLYIHARTIGTIANFIQSNGINAGDENEKKKEKMAKTNYKTSQKELNYKVYNTITIKQQNWLIQHSPFFFFIFAQFAIDPSHSLFIIPFQRIYWANLINCFVSFIFGSENCFFRLWLASIQLVPIFWVESQYNFLFSPFSNCNLL